MQLMQTDQEGWMPQDLFVLITAAHNEEDCIETTIRSIVNQTMRPLKWLIVSDASHDRTDEIARLWASQYPFIECLRVDRDTDFSFAAKANAIGLAYDQLKGLKHDFVGIVDADVAYDPDYFSRLIQDFRSDAALGISGGFIYENEDGVFVNRRGNRHWSVAGATQMFRRECFEAIGGILPMPFGGEDWRCEIAARMKGWTVRSNPDLKVLHYRHTGTARSPFRYAFRQGQMDYSMGSLPSFVFLKCLGRMTTPHLAMIVLSRLGGFVSSYWVGPRRTVSREFVRFLRNEQRVRILDSLHSVQRRLHPERPIS